MCCLTNYRLDVLEAGLGEVPQQSEGALPNLRHGVLHALVEQSQNVGANDQSLNVAAQSLCHACIAHHHSHITSRETERGE